MKQRRRRLWYKIVSALACVVVFCTTYALILPAITMENPRILNCPLVIHTHTSDCYDEDGVLTCGQADFVIHTHNESCYDEHGSLVCTLSEIQEHEHTGYCFEQLPVLICELEETEGHQHDESCYATERGELICEIDIELEEHEHTDECYEQVPILLCELEESRGHQHDESCYTEETALLCGLEENEGHQHDENCYTVGLGALICKNGDEDHEHTEDCYEQTLVLTCGMEEGEGAHTHTEDCYGQTTVLTCGLEEDEGAHVHGHECYLLDCETEEGEGAHFHSGECYEITLLPTCGGEEVIPHTHTEECYDEYGALTCGQLEVLEHVHTDECFRIVEQSAPAVYTYEDETVSVKVTLAGDSAVPRNAELAVRPITGAAAYSLDGGDGYEDLVRRAEEAVGQPVTDILLYDISFYTPDGEYLPVEDSATVSLRFKEAVFPEGTGGVTVLHFQEDRDLPEVLEAVDVTRDGNDEVAAVTFETGGFSTFGIMPLADTDGTEDKTGSSFTLTYNGYTITFNIVDSDGNAILGDYSSYKIDAQDAARYIFGVADASSLEENTNDKTSVVQNIAPEIAGYTYSGATYSGSTVYSVGINGYDGVSGFRFYGTEPPDTSNFYTRGLGNYAVTLTYISDTATDYTGDWAIVNRKSTSNNSGVAMLASGLNDSETANRAGQTVSLVQSEDAYSVADGAVTLWHFEKQDNGTYYISTMVDGTTNYLMIGTSAVTLSDIPQPITVTEGTGTYAGMVRLTNSSGIAVNLYGGSADQGFGSYSDKGDNEWQTLCKLLAVSEGTLFYDLDVAATYVDTHIFSGNWVSNAPALTDSDGNLAVVQTVTEDGSVLYSAGTPGGDYEYFTTRAVDKRSDIGTRLGVNGKEFRFDGWAATVKDENGDQAEYHFAANAQAVLEEDGIHITDEDDVDRVLLAGTMLTARWTEVSDIVMFFVNYTGTILDTEGSVSGRNQQDFTGIIGIGRVYYGKAMAGNDNVFGGDANADIRLKFANAFDPYNPETQIVMEYVTVYDENVTRNDTADDLQTSGAGYNLYHDADGINDTELEVALLQFIRDNASVTIKVSTADNTNNPVIENENSTPDNYSVRWYVMKEQNDGWHIDGVMVAKTQEVAVAKTFSGLNNDQVKGLLSESSNDGFNIPVKLGENRQDYITMTTQSIEGQYEYLGQESTGGQSYDWTLHAITDERYTLSEENYDLEGYDVSAVVVHYYRDENGQLQIAYQAGSTTKGLTPEVLGGKTVGVSFNNFYTESGTGAFAIHKSANDRTGQSDVGSALQGATFTLYSDADCTTSVITSTTNTRGSAYFNNLKTGTYYLTETAAPNGYLADGSVWKVVVENTGTEGDAHIKVTVSQYKEDNGKIVTDAAETVCYDGGIQASYEIHNTPTEDTVRVTKTFSGLTIEQLNALVKDSTETLNGYYIEVSSNNVTGTVSPGTDGKVRLNLTNSTRSQDGWTFTWVISGLKMTDDNGNSIPYKIVERNYFIYNEDDSLAYKDVAVTAAVNGTAQDVDVYRFPEDGKKYAEATVGPVEFHTDRSDLVELTNHYTNTFNLTLQKIDSVTKQPLPNAVFDVYGSYSESTESAKQISYTDPETGQTQTAYYIDTITADEKGIATKTGLSLSEDGSATFVYVINESFSPSGYVKLDEPIVQTVTVSTDGYAHGVYTADVPNTKEQDYVHAALDTVKVWNPDTPPTGATVKLELYRVTHGERNVALADVVAAELVAQVTLDGTADELQTATDGEYTITAYESAPWTATWMNLYSASKDYSEEDPDHYHYFVREVTRVNGYAASYTCYDANGAEPEGAFQTLRVTKDGNTETFQGVLIADMDEAYTATVVNTTSFELPETGGMGPLPYYAIGGALLMACGLLYGYKLRRKLERRYRR